MNTKNNILTYPHPVLLSQSQPVREVSQEIRNILNEMTTIMKINDGIGLAAPQIGILKRLITVFLNGRLYQIINPEIRWYSGCEESVERCLSLPNEIYKMRRAEEVVIEGIGPDEKEVSILSSGLLASVFQHETDHLDGILISSAGTYVLSNENNQGEIS